jgi:hypothetical protein
MLIINLFIKWLTLLVTKQAYVSFCQHSFVIPLEHYEISRQVVV